MDSNDNAQDGFVQCFGIGCSDKSTAASGVLLGSGSSAAPGSFYMQNSIGPATAGRCFVSFNYVVHSFARWR